MKTQCFLILCFGMLATTAFAQEQKSAEKKPTDLRLLNTAVFGKPTTEPVVLLEPPSPEALDPETVMVDINKGHYFAATVRYPTDIGFDDARKSLNKVYGKWEKESFATDADMGLWRNPLEFNAAWGPRAQNLRQREKTKFDAEGHKLLGSKLRIDPSSTPNETHHQPPVNRAF